MRNEWRLSPVHDSGSGTDPLTYRRTTFLISIPIAVFAFLLFTGNLFTLTNLTFWQFRAIAQEVLVRKDALAVFFGKTRLIDNVIVRA